MLHPYMFRKKENINRNLKIKTLLIFTTQTYNILFKVTNKYYKTIQILTWNLISVISLSFVW